MGFCIPGQTLTINKPGNAGNISYLNDSNSRSLLHFEIKLWNKRKH